ncbi:uncharacterized protein [Clytia hemisphaerica]
MSSTNVSSSLSTAFKRAKVLTPQEKQRVCCTRIRCGIATYACNEGGMEMSYFAKHFMKNREETTGLHYNLLSNRRHALNIAMRLYDSFSGEQQESEIQDKLAEEIKKSSESIKSVDHVIKWLKDTNPDMEKAEVKNFEDILKELVQTNTSSFYANKTNGEEDGDKDSGCNSTISSSPKKINVEDDDTDSAYNSTISGPSTTSTIQTAFKEKDKQQGYKARDFEQHRREKKYCTPKKQNDEQNRRVKLNALLVTPKRKGEFTKETLRAIGRSCEEFIFNGNIIQDDVMEKVGKEPSLAKFTFPKLRSKIAYLRLQLMKEGVILAGQTNSKNKKTTKKESFTSKTESESESDDDEDEDEEEEEYEEDDSDNNDEEESTDDEDFDSNDEYSDDHSSSSEKAEITPRKARPMSNHDVTVPKRSQDTESELKVNCKKVAKVLVSNLSVSSVMKHCKDSFQLDAKRSLRKRNRQTQEEIAKENCLQDFDPSGFREVKIGPPINGYGVFAEKPFSINDYLLCYRGDLLDEEEGDRREKSHKAENLGSFIFHFEHIVKGKKTRLCIDATKSDGLCRLVNDSPHKHANCKMIKVEVKEEEHRPYLCLFAYKNIEPGEELRYDYGNTQNNKLSWRTETKEQSIKPFRIEDVEAQIKNIDDDVIPPTPDKKRKKTCDETHFTVSIDLD